MAKKPTFLAARNTSRLNALGTQRNSLRGIETSQINWPRTLHAKRQNVLIQEHLRYKNKIARPSILHCFLVDCSGSMLKAQQLALVKGALLHLHQRAYQQRANIALISFAGEDAVIRINPTAARPFNAQQLPNALTSLQGGGGTPFARAIATADTLFADSRRRKPEQQCWLWLFSDGRSIETPMRPAFADVVRVVDCEQQRIALNRCHTLAENWDADYQTLDDLAQLHP